MIDGSQKNNVFKTKPGHTRPIRVEIRQNLNPEKSGHKVPPTVKRYLYLTAAGKENTVFSTGVTHLSTTLFCPCSRVADQQKTDTIIL